MFSNGEKKQIADFTKKLLEGDYMVPFSADQYSNQYKDAAKSIEYLKNQLMTYTFETQVAVDQIASVSDCLESSLRENQDQTTKIYEQSNQLNHLHGLNQKAVGNAVSAFEKIQELLGKSSGITKELLEDGIHSQQTIELGLEEIYGIITIINNIARSTDQTSQYIEQLRVSYQEIQSILKTVENFAKQTQLLSLNASIESARAGEYGKGFGVVATEIRTLAEESNHAVTNISSLIQTIQEKVDRVTEQNTLNTNQVEKAVSHTENIDYHLHQIQESYETVQKKIQNLTDMNQIEHQLLLQVNTSIGEMKHTSEETSANFENIYQSIQEQMKSNQQMGQLEVRLQGSTNSLIALSEKCKINLLENNQEVIQEKANELMDWLIDKLAQRKEIRELDEKIHQQFLEPVIEKKEELEAIWTNRIDGSFIYSNPPAGIVNARVREWFQNSVQGDHYISAPYISAITKNPCVTISFPLKNLEDEIITVVGADIKITIF